MGMAPLALAIEQYVEMFSVKVPIQDKQSLAFASDIIRDGEIKDCDIRFDYVRKIINLTIWKHERGQPHTTNVDKSQHVNWYSLPLHRYEIEFLNVCEVQIKRRDAGEGKHPIGGLRFSEMGVICLDTYDGITYEFTVDELLGTLWSTGDRHLPNLDSSAG